ncbi:hypothetical protein [Burkholderia cenocepacia]|uniref:hypothetical protein n=1 Tax=Burkholderia cenocepacia TaxID=95486 RepID=UPI002653FEC2|nr:hypothetical protein [Burkholderia cenocepacia]MDN7541950.1 hypothetical protein [Burkholderia cenocepacia]
MPGIVTPRNIVVGQPAPAAAPAPQVGNLIDQMRAAGQLPQMAGYGAQPITPAPVAVVPALAAPAPKQNAQAFVNSLPVYNPTPSAAAAATPNSRALMPPLPPGLPGGASVAPAQSAADIAGQGTWANGTNTAPAAGGAGATVAGKFIDPAEAIQRGFDQQVAYRQQALQDIMAAAHQGNPGNYSFRLAHLIGAMGANNFGAVQGQGVDALNQSIAGVSSAGIGAGAAMYGADQALAGRLAEVGEQHYQSATGSVPLGTTIGADPITGMAVPLTTYGQRPAAAGMVPTPYSGGESKKPIVGKTYVDKSGNRAVYQSDGSYKPVGQ